jgi:serine/threonine protein phosphatase PrpC
VRSGFLRGRDHREIGAVAAVAEGRGAIALSRGGAHKVYAHVEPNEDAAIFALGSGGTLLAVADGHDGAYGAEKAVEHLLVERAAAWTGRDAPAPSAPAWRELACETFLAAAEAIATTALERRLPVAATTLSFALVRPGEGRLLHASIGDSHVFPVRAGEPTPRDLGWASRAEKRTWFLAKDPLARSDLDEKCVTGCESLAGLRALVLATDGLSERGIGVRDPAAAVRAAVDGAVHSEPELRPLHACKGVVAAALRAQREQRCGDNIACALLWLDQD